MNDKRLVLDHGWVELEECMGLDPAVARAARICYRSEAKGPQSDGRLIGHLMKANHNTPFEHAVFRWGVKAPLFVARQWMRHRIGTFNEMSMRYVSAEDAEFYVPEDLLLPAQLLYEEALREAQSSYALLTGWGVPKEQARGVLPVAIYTEFVWTVNAWSLMNWLEKRLCEDAQWEHREYAGAILDLWGVRMPLTCRAFITHRLGDA